MDSDRQQLLTRELNPGERLLWAGGARRGVKFRAYDFFVIPFSLLWSSLPVYLLVISLQGKGEISSPLFYVVIPAFTLFGLYYAIGRFFVDAWQRSNTAYGVTSERILIIYGILGRSTKTVAVRSIGELTLRERSDGGGTITFDPPNPFSWFGPRRIAGFGWESVFCLELSDDARKVYDLIRSAQRPG